MIRNFVNPNMWKKEVEKKKYVYMRQNGKCTTLSVSEFLGIQPIRICKFLYFVVSKKISTIRLTRDQSFYFEILQDLYKLLYFLSEQPLFSKPQNVKKAIKIMRKGIMLAVC